MADPEFTPSDTTTRLTTQPWGSQEVIPYTDKATEEWIRYVEQHKEDKSREEPEIEDQIRNLGGAGIKGAENGGE